MVELVRFVSQPKAHKDSITQLYTSDSQSARSDKESRHSISTCSLLCGIGNIDRMVMEHLEEISKSDSLTPALSFGFNIYIFLLYSP
jgi:hypothetical protein